MKNTTRPKIDCESYPVITKIVHNMLPKRVFKLTLRVIILVVCIRIRSIEDICNWSVAFSVRTWCHCRPCEIHHIPRNDCCLEETSLRIGLLDFWQNRADSQCHAQNHVEWNEEFVKPAISCWVIVKSSIIMEQESDTNGSCSVDEECCREQNCKPAFSISEKSKYTWPWLK